MAEIVLPETAPLSTQHAQLIQGPSQISFDITNRCNYRCLHCYNRSGENLLIKDELNDSEIISLAQDISTVKPLGFCFCGGEPLLRNTILYKAANILSSAGVTVSLVTNGSLVTKQVVHKLVECGVTGIQVSLDGASPETHERLRCHPHAFKYAVNAIILCKETGVFRDVSVAFTPTSFNCHEVEDTYRLCKKLGATSFRMQPLIIQGRTEQQLEDFLPTPLQYRSLVRTMNKIKHEGGIPILWGDPVDHLIRFRTTCKHCVTFSHIKANGDIAVSPYLPLVVGNIRKHTYSSYWNAGLVRVWERTEVKNLSKRITSIRDFGKKEQNIPRAWFEKDLTIDIIEKEKDTP